VIIRLTVDPVVVREERVILLLGKEPLEPSPDLAMTSWRYRDQRRR
jgi:hypothetical protein